MAEQRAEAMRAIVRALLSSPAVDMSDTTAGGVDAVIDNILDWARRMRDSRDDHARLGRAQAQECDLLEAQCASILGTLGMKPEDLSAAAMGKASPLAEQLGAMLLDESEKWEPVLIEPVGTNANAGGGGSAAADDTAAADSSAVAAPDSTTQGPDSTTQASSLSRTLSYRVNSRGVLKVRLANAASTVAFMPGFFGVKSAPAVLELKIHRVFACEDGKQEKLPVEYTVTVGQAPLKRAMWGGALLALFRSDRASAKADNDSYLFSKHLRVEQEQTFMLSARPGDLFVCEVKLAEGSAPVRLETSFLDMKLAGALDNLRAAREAYSTQGMAQVQGVVERVEALRRLTAEHAEAKAALATEEGAAAELRAQIATQRTSIGGMADTVRAELEAEEAAGAATRQEFVEQRLAAERQKLERLKAQALDAVERGFAEDREADLRSPGGDSLAESRTQRLAAERATLDATLAAKRQELVEARATLALVQEATTAEEERLERAFADATQARDVAEAGKLQQARISMKRIIYDRTEAAVVEFLSGHHAALDAAVRARHEAICSIRNLPNQDAVLGLLREWDYNGAHSKLAPYLL